MNQEEVLMGMKVVPHQKTVEGWCVLEKCYEWEDAKDKKQPYLFVVGWEEDIKAFILSCDPNSYQSGDFFNPEDFTPYVETEESYE